MLLQIFVSLERLPLWKTLQSYKIFSNYGNFLKEISKINCAMCKTLERIKQFIDCKGLSVSAFEKSVGMSNASFGKSLKNKGAIGTDKLEKYPKGISGVICYMVAYRAR